MKLPSVRHLPAVVLTLLVLLGHAGSAHAEWFFRGTANAWGSTQMSFVGGSEYRTCQTFAGGDGGGGPRFKIDRFGNWGESYPASDRAVTDNASYSIAFFSDSKAITVTAVADCGGFLSTLPSLNFRGTPNAWASTPMQRVADNTWELLVDFNGVANQRFKLDVLGDWSWNYGDNNADGSLDLAGADIFTTVVGQRLLRVNDSSLSWQLIDPNPTPPPAATWFFRGTPNAWGSTAMSSSDGVNFCLDQHFASGDAGGGPRFKIDRFGDWSESYPAADVAVSPNSDQHVCFDAGSKAITVTPIGTPPPPGSVGDFRAETIYFLLTARFYDGDAGNNYFNRDRIKAGDPQWRGDFKGLIAKLDYIKNLGFTAIWVTPPVENRSGLDYHGYHAYDWNKVDPRLESPGASYQDLIDAAHAKGLKVIQDVVVNHSSQYGIRGKVWIDHLPIKYFVPAGSTQGQIVNPPYLGNLGDYLSANRDDNDNPVAPAWFRDRHNSDPNGTTPLVDPTTGATVPSPGYNPNRFFGVDPFALDGNWYHLDGFMAGGDWESPVPLVNKSIAGDAIDLNTGSQVVKDYLNGAIRNYLDMGVDAIRLDTAKHVERNELLTYVHDWQAHKPGTFVFGEVLVFGAGFGNELGSDNASAVIRPWWYTRTGSSPSNPQGDSGLSVLDFPLFSTFRDNVTRGSFSGIGGVLGMDWTYADPTQLVTFFQNHDAGPDNDFKFRYGGAQSNAALAYNLLWTIRGIPALYYGEEVQFQGGKPEDIQSATDTLDLTGRAYYGAVLDDPNTPNHALYRHVQRLNQIRHAIPALQVGRMEQVNEWGAGMRFVRHLDNAWAVVGLAAGTQQSISVGGIPNGTWRDAVTGTVVQVSNGSLSFTVKPFSAGVYVLDGPGKIGSDGVYLR